jgi:cytochrome c-type biogenesis protein CcmF
VAAILAIAVPLLVYGGISILLAIGLFSAFWLMGASLKEPVAWLVRRKTLRGYPRSMLGMAVAHFGIAVFVLGVAVTSAFSIEKDISVRPGERNEIAGYGFEFRGTKQIEGPNYTAAEGEIAVFDGDKQISILRPQKRVYRVQRNPMTESGIQPRLSRDLYVALGEPLGGDSWSIRMQYKPLIRLIWLGALIMALGGAIAASDRRYRVPREAEAPARTGAEATT